MREHAVLLAASANPHADAWRLGKLNLKVLLNELSVRCTSCTNRSSLEVSKREVDVLRIVPLVPVQRGADSASSPAGLRNNIFSRRRFWIVPPSESKRRHSRSTLTARNCSEAMDYADFAWPLNCVMIARRAYVLKSQYQ